MDPVIIRGTVASLRLDAVAALGFSTSRSKIAEEIKAERVRVNSVPVTDPSKPVKLGDTITAKGRRTLVKLEEVTGQTKKGRLGIVVSRSQCHPEDIGNL
ncbi:MAG TPA: hypothetical protein GX509_03650 [Firmicutes bacterium]|nr:hypothetical protein [Bacillota bacterium]HHY97818.1 hypothetical protein [Bacillota bacterium]